MAGLTGQFGVKNETTYGTAVVVNRFFEFDSETMKLDAARIESQGIYAGGYFDRDGAWVVNRQGGGGGIPMDVWSKGFGFWLPHMFGSIATTGPTDSAYAHTATIGSVTGKFFTGQVGKPDNTDTVNPFTYPGSKVMSWQLANSVDGLLKFTPTLSTQDEVTSGSSAFALQTASYPTGRELLSFVGASLTIGGSSWDVATDATVACDLGLKDRRRFLRGTSLQKEPVAHARRQMTVTLKGEFDGLTAVYNRFASSTASGAVAQIVLTWVGQVLIGTTTYPGLVLTMPACRADGDSPQVAGFDLVDINPTFKVLTPTNGASACTAVYTTLDATP